MQEIKSFSQVKNEALSEFKAFLSQEYPYQIENIEIIPHPIKTNKKSDMEILVSIRHWNYLINREINDLSCDLLLRWGVLVSPIIIDRDAIGWVED